MRLDIRLIALVLVFVSLTTMAIGVIPKVSAGGPLTPKMLIKIFYDPATENWALDRGDIDINDWPLSKDFIKRWSPPRTDIALARYAEIGKQQFDLNNQWWPTGPNDPTHASAAARNTYYGDSPKRDEAALHFRRAIAHLSNKPKYVTNFMGGMGYKIETEVPWPALEGFTDYETLSNATAKAARPGFSNGYIYEYNQTAAIKELELGGFKDWDKDTWIEWNKNYPNPWRGATDTEELPNMRLVIRVDDPNRRQAAEDLYNEMIAIRIPFASSAGRAGLEKIVTERITCYTDVMILYNYNIYTGGWSLTPDLDFIFDLYHSSMGQYSWAQNYAGFKNREFDSYAQKIKYPTSDANTVMIDRGGKIKSKLVWAAIDAQWVKAKYMPVVELFCAKAYKAVRSEWKDVVNYAGYGIDNGWSFMLMTAPGRTNIKYGLKSDITALHIISSEWLWDYLVLGLIYDSMIGRNPYNLPNEIGVIAQNWSAQTVATKTVATFTLRNDAYFHDGSQVKAADVAYSLLMPKAAGSGVAWSYPSVMDIDHVNINSNTVKVYFAVESYWAVHWAGFMSVLNKDLWQSAIGVGGFTGAGYTGNIPDNTNGDYYPGTFSNPTAVRDYHPWTDYRAGDPNKLDLIEDGSGPWVFESYVPGQYVTLNGFTGPSSSYFTTVNVQGYHDESISGFGGYSWKGGTSSVTFADYIKWAYHRVGNVNFPASYYATDYGSTNNRVRIDDLLWIIDATPASTPPPPWPPASGWGKRYPDYNIDTDITQDRIVDIEDLSLAGVNYGYSTSG